MDQTSPQDQPRFTQTDVSDKTDSYPAMNGSQDAHKPDVPATANGHEEANGDMHRDEASDEEEDADERAMDIQTDAPKKKKKKRKPKSKRGLVSSADLFKHHLTHLRTHQLAWKSSSPTPH
jgi:hypothetical protein